MPKNLKTASIISIVAVFFIADRVLKLLFAGLWRRAEFSVISDWLKLKLSLNSGLAFGLPANHGLIMILTGLAIFILIYLAYLSYRNNKLVDFGAYAFIIAGAASNFLDRLKGGLVIDYFDLNFFSIFNLADIFIVCGIAAVIIIHLKSGSRKEAVKS